MNDPIQIDGDKEITLRLKNSSVLFLSGMLGAQPSSLVTQHGQEGLLREIANQQAQQNGLLAGAPNAVVPQGAAVALTAPNRAARRTQSKRK